ncbi:MAG: radical SAM family heme chaperone HemW [Defluviimonas denitrificans]
MDDWQQGGFGLYLHWPFCASKCPYCDFNSHVVASVDQAAWRDAYLSELRRSAVETEGRVLSSVFFGGGTPSLMQPDLVAAILDEVRRLWPRANDLEVTLEANPNSVDSGRFRGYSAAGVNRISMGIQALNDADLRRLGRLHNVAEARRAFDIARDCFGRVSFDLIYARQHQALDDWRRELAEAAAMAVDHLSLYQLTIEDGTAFGARHAAGGLKGLPEDDIAADMYELTQEVLDTAGMPAYEVSNHARDGAESRHNVIYWRYGDYIGIGPGAHGRLTLAGQRFATEAPCSPQMWLDSVQKRGNGELPRTTLSGEDCATEYILMAMRLREGADMRRYHALAGKPLDMEAIGRLEDMGLLGRSGDRIAATASGRIVLNAILREIVA